MVQDSFWVIVLSVIMLPIVLKKELQELHIVSVTLFVTIMIFIFIVFLQLCLFGTHEFSEGEPTTFKDFQTPIESADFFTWVKSLCCMLVAFSF